MKLNWDGTKSETYIVICKPDGRPPGTVGINGKGLAAYPARAEAEAFAAALRAEGWPAAVITGADIQDAITAAWDRVSPPAAGLGVQ